MSLSNFTNFSKQQSSICPTNGRQTVGDGAFYTDMTPSVLAVCHMQGKDSLYYYSTTFSGGPGVSPISLFVSYFPLTQAAHSGGFDTPKAKCPPDRGSSDWVTDSLTPIFSSSPSDTSSTLSSIGTDRFASSIIYPPTPPLDDTDHLPDAPVLPGALHSAPRVIARSPLPDIVTPPLTPDDAEEGAGTLSAISAKQHDAALDFLSVLFPSNALGALSYAKSVSISAPNLGDVFDGVVLELPNTPKTFYVDGKNAANVNLRESIVALLDLADERLQCSALVIALEKSSPQLGDLLHSLMYVGGAVVTKPPFQVDPNYILVGLEI